MGSLCRIGIFYDGSYFAYAQRYFYHDRDLGWLGFEPFQQFIEQYVSEHEKGFLLSRIVYAAWFQGLDKPSSPTANQLRFDRRLYFDLMYAGINPMYSPKSQYGQEKGVDVALAIDALQIGLEGKIDVAVLVTGDGDLVPLARALMKQGIRVMVAYFKYEEGDQNSRISEHLLAACNYGLNVNALESDEKYRKDFASLFSKWEQANE